MKTKSSIEGLYAATAQSEYYESCRLAVVFNNTCNNPCNNRYNYNYNSSFLRGLLGQLSLELHRPVLENIFCFLDSQGFHLVPLAHDEKRLKAGGSLHHLCHGASKKNIVLVDEDNLCGG